MKIIISEQQHKNLKVRRNIIDKLPKYILYTYESLNPKAFNDSEEFLERVIFDVTRDYLGNFIDGPEDYDEQKNIIEPIVRKIVMNEYFDEILEYYNSHF